MTKDEATRATRAAGDRLAAIERWGKVTALASLIAAAASVVVAVAVGYAAVEYISLKRGMAEAARSWADRPPTVAAPSRSPLRRR